MVLRITYQHIIDHRKIARKKKLMVLAVCVICITKFINQKFTIDENSFRILLQCETIWIQWKYQLNKEKALANDCLSLVFFGFISHADKWILCGFVERRSCDTTRNLGKNNDRRGNKHLLKYVVLKSIHVQLKAIQFYGFHFSFTAFV